MSEPLLKYELLDILDKLDRNLYRKNPANKDKLKAILVGGAALVLAGYLERSTRDIDFIDASREIREYLSSKIKVEDRINMDVQAYLMYFPEDYEDRLVKLDAGGRKIEYFAMSLEDIVISKIMSYRDKDIQDIHDPVVVSKIDWALLDRLAAEKEKDMLNANEASIFRCLYKRYAEDCEGILKELHSFDAGAAGGSAEL